MSEWIIAAIPEPTDPVWKISSETMPHLTVIYLGEQESGPTLSAVMNAVSDVAQTVLPPFWLDVKERTKLGPKDADVLMFEGRDLDWITYARETLLTDPDISAAYESVEQYPTWTPHLTLGYPDNPAHPDLRSYPGVRSVKFDRLAVWALDSDGPTYNLNKSLRKEDTMTTTALDDFLETTDFDHYLEHHGIKGMKWGVRRTDAQLDGDSPTAAAPKGKRLFGRKKAAAESPIKDEKDNGQTIRSLDKKKPGSVVTMRDEDGGVRTLVKKKDGTWAETHMSVDAERFARTRQKEGHEMSDREMKEAIGRARSIREYNEMFSENPNRALQEKVDALVLEQKYASLKESAAPPSLMKRLGNLVETGEKAYEAYERVNTIYTGVSGKVKDASAAKAAAKAASDIPKASAPRASNPKTKRKRAETPVFNITDVGKPSQDFGDPFVLQLPRGS